MKCFPQLCVLVVTVLPLILSCFSYPALAAKDQCLVLEQNSKSFGRYQILIAPTVVKLINKSKNIIQIARLMDGKVFAFKPDLKLIYEADLNNWKPQLAQRMVFIAGETMEAKSYKFTGIETIAGLRTKRLESTEEKSETTMMLKGTHTEARPSRVGISDKKLWVLDGQSIPKQLENFVAKMYGLPALGLPIRFSAVMENSRKALMCDTLEAKRVPLKSVDFSIPVGYKRVKSDGDLYMDNTGSQLLDFMR